MQNYEKYMQMCFELAKKGSGFVSPNPLVGCVVLDKNDNIISTGYHHKYGDNHAERDALLKLKNGEETGGTLIVNLEPCSHYGKTPPCADLIIKKGIRRVVVGCIDEFAKVQGRGIQKIRDAGIEVKVGVLEAECKALNRRFFTFHREKRPYIILKWAQTSNGFMDDHFKPIQISNDYTKMISHKLRAEEDAILVGRVTAERDHPQLTVREWHGSDPKRLVVDRTHPLNLESLHAHQIQSLIVEGGAKTLESFIEKNLWDEIRVEVNSSMSVIDGTRAPQIPANAEIYKTEDFNGNRIMFFRQS